MHSYVPGAFAAATITVCEDITDPVRGWNDNVGARPSSQDY
jgi:hypothetical protein